MIATTRGELYRGTTQDALGDEVDDNSTPIEIRAGRTDFPVSIIEAERREYDEASNAWRTVRYYAGRVSAVVPVKAGDRIKDLYSGAFYVVDEAERMARGISGRSSVTLTMKRTSP
jgi:hypothetical protein